MGQDNPTKVAVINLGCPKNQVDAENMLGLLQRDGFLLTGNPEEADAVIVNTCGFIRDAKEESVTALLNAVRLKKRGKVRRVLAAGCLAQRYGEELRKEIPALDGIIGIGAQEQIAAAVRKALAGDACYAVGAPRPVLPEAMPRVLSTPPWTAYLKIADGCDRACSFCAIPQIRGAMISRPLEGIVAEAEQLAAQGVRELVLIAQDTSSYGKDRYGELRLADLMRALCRIEGIEWIRPLYYYPTCVTDELIDLVAGEPKLCKYMDIPLQHVAGPLLRQMHRPGDGEAYLRLVEKIRSACPEIALRSTFIVGFPGETEDDFRQLLQFIAAAQLDRVGVFQFSPEEGTAAAALPNRVRPHTAQRRYERFMEAQQAVSLARNQRLLGKTLPILLESPADADGFDWIGRSYRDAPEIDGAVSVRGAGRPGEFVPVTITKANEYDLEGVVKTE